jgi:hypothetical protein
VPGPEFKAYPFRDRQRAKNVKCGTAHATANICVVAAAAALALGQSTLPLFAKGATTLDFGKKQNAGDVLTRPVKRQRAVTPSDKELEQMTRSGPRAKSKNK